MARSGYLCCIHILYKLLFYWFILILLILVFILLTMSVYSYVIFSNHDILFTLTDLFLYFCFDFSSQLYFSFSFSHKLRAMQILINYMSQLFHFIKHPPRDFFPFRVLIVRVLVHNHSVCRPRTAETINYRLWETKPAL